MSSCSFAASRIATQLPDGSRFPQCSGRSYLPPGVFALRTAKDPAFAISTPCATQIATSGIADAKIPTNTFFGRDRV